MPKTPPAFFITQLERLLDMYQEIAVSMVSTNKACGDIIISETAFTQALNEADKDVAAICARRLDTFTISKGAGILLFRLSRANIVHVSESMDGDSVSLSLNSLTSIGLVLSKMAGIRLNKVSPAILLELQFTLERRHMNQETLAICIESIKSAIR